MAVSTAAGYPQYSGTFIPEIWSGKLNVKYYKNTCLTAITNSDYEGELKNAGDKVIIRQIPDIKSRKYVKGQPLITDYPEAPNLELKIDRARYFRFACDDIDKKQSDMKFMDDWSNDASQQQKIAIEEEFFGEIYADADAANKGATAGKQSKDINLGVTGTPLNVTKSNILEVIVDVGTVMDEQNIPEDNRALVIPARIAGLIKKSDLKDASITGDGQSVMRNGRLGMIDRFTLYTSNCLTSVTDSTHKCWHVLGIHKSAVCFANNFVKTRNLESESTFASIIDGLQVYDWKALKGEGLVDLYCYL